MNRVRSSDGTRLAVRRVGAGDPVVLVHGSGGGLHSWAAVADRLADSGGVARRVAWGAAGSARKPPAIAGAAWRRVTWD